MNENVTMIVLDPRIEQTITVAEALVNKSLLNYTQVLVTPDNMTVLIVNNTLLYEIPLKNINNFYPPSIAFMYNNIDSEVGCENDIFLEKSIYDCYNGYRYIRDNNPILAIDNELRNNEEFESLLNLKADDGMKYYKMPGNNPDDVYLIPMFSGFINLSKPDKIGIRLIDIDSKHLLIEMNIYKKKISRDIKVYCRIIKL